LVASTTDASNENLFDDKNSKATKVFPPELRRVARRKLQYLHEAADLRDLKSPPGNRLEGLKGDLKGSHSIRINDQWRVVFRWSGGNAFDVQVVDYH
jgi:toxin HigB-1